MHGRREASGNVKNENMLSSAEPNRVIYQDRVKEIDFNSIISASFNISHQDDKNNIAVYT